MQALTIAEEAFLEPEETTIAGLRLRPFSMGSLNAMRKLGLDLTDEASEEDKLRALAGVVWVHSRPVHEVLRAIRKGAAQDDIDAFMFSIDLASMPELNAEVARISAQINASSVSIELKPGDREETPPGNS